MLKSNFKKLLYISFITAISVIHHSCDSVDPEPIGVVERGQILRTTSLGVMTPEDIEQIFTSSNIQLPFTLQYEVESFSIEYYTDDRNGRKVLVSGALLLPKTDKSMPLLSLQHGTQSKRDLVASVSPLNSAEGQVGLLTASLGYLTLIPDYIGFGISDEMHPYFHVQSLIPSVIDFMRAGKTYSSQNNIALDGRVFLTGYSEGGYLSLLTQKVIEEDYSSEFNLTAVAPSAGPYDLKGTIDSAFQSNRYEGDIAYIGFFFTAYNEVYGWNRLDEIFSNPYASRMSNLYNGSKTWGEIMSQLPDSFSELMNPGFVTSYLSGTETDVIEAVKENTILNWTPQTQIHFFHGDADITVPYQNVLTAISSFEANGATNIQLTTISGGTHASSGAAASIGAIQWFESL